MNRYFPILFVVFLSYFVSDRSHAQLYGEIGYGGGYGTPNELNKMIYLHNKLYNPSNKMNPIRTFRGIHLSVGYLEELGIELRFQKRSAYRQSVYSTGNQNYQKDLRLRKNTLHVNFLFGEDQYHFGVGCDYGKMKAYGRTFNKNETATEYENLAGSSNGLSSSAVGFSLLFDYAFADVFGLRVTYQWQWGATESDNLDDFLLDSDSFGIFPPEVSWGNIGFDLYFRFGDF